MLKRTTAYLCLAVLGFLLLTSCSPAPATRAPVSPAMTATTLSPVILPPGSGLITGPLAGEVSTLTGIGSTAVAPLMSNWAAAYEAITSVANNYASQGSGAGIQAITDCTASYAASDAPMSDAQLAAAVTACGSQPVIHIPLAVMGVVVIYNVPELGTTQLRLSADTVAALFRGEITVWNDPRLVSENPLLANVTGAVSLAVRSDSSGTTRIFTEYMQSASAVWRDGGIGAGNSVQWIGSATIAVKGNAGVAAQVTSMPYSVGYVEYTYASQNNLAYAAVQNSAGNWISPSPASISLAADVALPADMRVLLVNSSNPQAYAISGFTWMLLRPEQPDTARGLAMARFAWWAVHDGQAMNTSLGYAPLPAGVIVWAESALTRLTVNGQPVLPPGLLSRVTLTPTPGS